MKNSTTITIETELKRRMDLVNDFNFRKTCAKHAEAIGVTPKEWNENKAIIIMKFANDFCSFENTKNKA
tara:strand:+ start:385 stop:591 length:207 start_codon:yes stop_codon:yes gene_type:complete